MPSSTKRHLLVANPTAQSGRAREHIAEALDALRARGLVVETCTTEPDRRTIAKVRDRIVAGGVDVVIYLGGDGTFHEVATALLLASEQTGSTLPLGMLPGGTANDQGLSFGIERGETERNVEVIADAHVTQLDVGRIELLGANDVVDEWSWFFDSASFGVSSDILAMRNRHRSLVSEVPLLREVYRDKLVYFSATMAKLLESYVEPLKFRADVTVDGEAHTLEGLLDLIASATPIYAGHWVLDRHAEPDDGVFELIPMQGRRDWVSKAMRDLAVSPIWQEQLDALGVTHSSTLRGRTFVLDLFRPERCEVLAQVDGEEWHAGNRYRIAVLPRRLPVLTPREFKPPWRP
ncbi:MAG: hypothetical protein FJ095_07190 [Deltaproteobacteria bacterium]|nr:hypothetical protein [Deltaproteobacteria bacterium]